MSEGSPAVVASRTAPKIRPYKSSPLLVGNGSPSTSRNVRRPSASYFQRVTARLDLLHAERLSERERIA